MISKKAIAKRVTAKLLGDNLAGKEAAFFRTSNGIRSFVTIEKSRRDPGGSITIWIKGSDHWDLCPMAVGLLLIDELVYVIQGEGSASEDGLARLYVVIANAEHSTYVHTNFPGLFANSGNPV